MLKTRNKSDLMDKWIREHFPTAHKEGWDVQSKPSSYVVGVGPQFEIVHKNRHIQNLVFDSDEAAYLYVLGKAKKGGPDSERYKVAIKLVHWKEKEDE